MWKKRIAAIALGLCACTGLPAQAAEVAGVQFENSTLLDERELALNGVGLRSVAFFKGYAAGLYVARRSSDVEVLISQAGPKRIMLRMLRDADSDTFTQAFLNGLRKNYSEAQLEAMKPRMDRLEQNMQAVRFVRKGDRITIDLSVDNSTRIAVNGTGKGMPIFGADFYGAIMRIFIGERPVDAALKKGLLGQAG